MTTTPHPDPTQPPKPKQRRWVRVVGIIGLIAVAGIVVSVLTEGSDAPIDRAGPHCERMVTERLISPATAAFSGVSTVKTQDNLWVTTGSVDAQNAMGALLRQDFVCESEVRDEGLWTTITQLGA